MRSLFTLLSAVALGPPAATAAVAQQPGPAPSAAPQTGAMDSAGAAAKLGLSAYPAKGQSKNQQAADEKACDAWAREQTGIDPATVKANPDSAAAVAKAKTDSATAGAGVRGAARGATGGAVVGGIAGDAGTGAGVGAVTGAAAGRKKKKQAEKQTQEQAKSQSQAQATQLTDTFKKAMSACLEGKGYSLK